MFTLVEKKRRRKQRLGAAEAEKQTIAWLVEHPKGFLEQYAKRNQRVSTQNETRRILKRVMPYLGDKLLVNITRSDLTEMLDSIAAGCGAC